MYIDDCFPVPDGRKQAGRFPQREPSKAKLMQKQTEDEDLCR